MADPTTAKAGKTVVTGLCGLAPVVLGLIVIFGWHSHNEALIQVSPTLVPMQYNTALGFLASGLGLIAALRSVPKVAQLFGVLVVVIGGLTLIEYIFSVDLLIDQLLMEHSITVGTSHPGRMAPNTALCFVFTGLGLVAAGRLVFDLRTGTMAGVSGSLVSGLGLIAFSGYAMDLETAYGWGSFTRMAMHTSGGFIVLGAGLTTFAWLKDDNKTHYPSWFPLGVAIGILTVTISLWQALISDNAIGFAQHFVLIFGTALSVALAAITNFLKIARDSVLAKEVAIRELNDEAHKRQVAQVELAEAHDQLEAKVEERTKELRDSEERFSNFFKLPLIGAAIYSATDKSWISISDGFCQMVGYSREELNTLTWVELTHPDDLKENIRLFERAISGEDDGTYSMEKRFIQKDGEIINVEIHAQCIRDRHGKPNYVILSVRNITERKRAEEELRLAKERAEIALADLTKAQEQLVQSQKMSALGELTAGIAHEIKNPLNFVSNFAETSVELLDELKVVIEPVLPTLDGAAKDDAEHLISTLTEDLATIANHGKRADAIMKNMLLHAREQAGEPEPTDLNALVDESLKLAYHGERARHAGFNITMENNFDEALGMVTVMPQELTRVLVNLFSNSFYATIKRREAGGEYDPKLQVSTRAVDGQAEIRIRDNGTGMPKDVAEKIFNPFFTTKPAGEGTGLGLSLSFDIVVQKHGGSMRVESEEGVFTEFIITLPKEGVEEAKK